MSTPASGRRYLAVHLPFLPAERRISAGTAPPDAPFAMTEARRGALRIVALSPGAVQLGLAVGMALADARARVPELAAFAHDPAGERACLVWLAEACERYTPTIEPVPQESGEGALLLDLTGCLGEWGAQGEAPSEWRGEAALARDLVRRLSRHGLTARIAHAATPDAALALARFGEASAGALPVAALGLGGETHLALTRAGLRTLADLAARPRAPLAARFGRELPQRLARLLGEEDRRLTPHRAAPEVMAEQRFAEPMATVSPLLGVVERLAGDIAGQLERLAAGGRRFDLALFRTDGHVARLTVASGQPLRAPARVRGLFAERLESLADPLDPGFGYDMVRLAVPLVERLEAAQADLGGGGDGGDRLAMLIDRLAVRFGPRSVSRLAPRDEHLPELTERRAAPLDSPPAAAPAGDKSASGWPAPEPGEPPLRPLFLYEPPQRVTILAEVPDGPPRRFGWRGRQHRVVRQEGPERIAYPWWKHPQGRGPTRDYYRVEDESGQRYWLFRHGLYGEGAEQEQEQEQAPAAGPHWYIHGLFA